ncbi:MAG: PD-(D/E)XK nuclease-like domain-containing protein [Gammaproteobacteria bacterium]|nr:PD-(D/E)XK nuclease-like domain-containing protein [Gammaproteobacteria bacterium]
MAQDSDPLFASGIYPDVPFDMYLALPAVSRSQLAVLAQGQTPAHLRYEMDHPPTPTRAMTTGTAVHTAILEPDQYGSQFVPGLDRAKRSNADKQAWAEYEKQIGSAQILSLDEWDQVAAMANAARRYPPLVNILDMDHWTETTLLFDAVVAGRDQMHTIQCKARPDIYIPEIKTLVDIKTTDNASLDAFQRSIERYGYHWQAGFYTNALLSLEEMVEHFVVVAIEKKPPYLCAAYRMDPAVVMAGWDELQEPLRRYAEAKHLDTWSGYSDQIEDAQLPPWKMRDLLTYGDF